MTTYRLREFARWVKDFIPRALNGYEPVAARAFLSSLFIALALFGIGTGELPGQVDKVLAALSIIVPALLGIGARGKVSPVGALPDEVEGDDSPDDDFAPVEGVDGYATPLRDLSAGDSEDDEDDEPGDHRLGKPIED